MQKGNANLNRREYIAGRRVAKGFEVTDGGDTRKTWTQFSPASEEADIFNGLVKRADYPVEDKGER